MTEANKQTNSNRTQKRAISIIVIFCVLIFVFLQTFGVSGGGFAAAAETNVASEGIMQELGGLTIDGKKFNAEDYPADGNGTPQVLLLNEVGYSYYANKREAYGLTVYVYNPAQLAVKDDIRNTLQLRIGKAARFDKYRLSLESESTDKLFYKFKVAFSATEKAAVLSVLDKDGRIYEISSIELYTTGYNATDYGFNPTRMYTYTGYAAGFGQTDGGASTLSGTLGYTIVGGTETIPLSVKHTSWRPEGTNGTDEYKQDSICSVYFAIPDKFAKEYDYLKSVKCTWYEAQTAPMFVTDCEEIIWPLIYLWEDQNALNAESIVNEAPEEFDFSHFEYLIGIGKPQLNNGGVGYDTLFADTLFGNEKLNGSKSDEYNINFNAKLSTLFWLLQSDKDDNVASSTLLETLRNQSEKGSFYNDKKVAGKYPGYLFDKWDKERTTEIIDVGKKYTLNSEEVKQHWWEELFNKSHVENKKQYELMEAIKEVADTDVYSGSVEEVCNRLYIGKYDYDEFLEFYEKATKEDSTVYLLRFDVSDYTRLPAKIYKETTIKPWIGSSYNTLTEVESKSYVAYETFYLDFDVIDLEYKKNDVSYIIPVSMSPIDITPTLTPPPFEEKSDFWKYAIGIMAGLTAFYVVYKIGCNVAEKSRRGL